MIEYNNLKFEIKDEKIVLNQFGNMTNLHSRFVEVQITGENKQTHMGAKMVDSSEGAHLRYHSHSISNNALRIVQRSDLIETTTEFICYADTNAVRIQTTVRNIVKVPIVLEEVSIFTITGFAYDSTFTRFLQSHHKECQPCCRSFAEWGLDDLPPASQKRIACANVGSWSSKEELPQGIIADTDGRNIMFQIESNASWYYEISDSYTGYYIFLGGPNLNFGGWSCELAPGKCYTTPAAAFAFGTDLNDVIGQMTCYRRHIAGNYPTDSSMPTIFNEYMHLSWDNPTAENTAKMAPIVAKTGTEYYVIDCGWHNEEDGNKVYPYVGQWKESRARFPEGIRKTTDMIRSLGMKPGLWIEPEIIGHLCKDMLEYYDDDCFIQRFGRRVLVQGRHFLDFRSQRVLEYMSETVRRMVEDYGAAYIKFDYNQDCGVGTDREAFTLGKGLEDCAHAFLQWVEKMHKRFPDVIFEGCASGGMRMDYRSLAAFSLASTSDQTLYYRYPYIVGNILMAVLPEQAAVWSYPVTEDCTGKDVSDDCIAMNMINSFLGRMHLASHLERLDDNQLALIRAGVDYYNGLTRVKSEALPYFPNGFAHFGDDSVCAGLCDGDKVYLAVWNLGGNGIVTANIANIRSADIAYPPVTDAVLQWDKTSLTVRFPRSKMAVFLEIQII